MFCGSRKGVLSIPPLVSSILLFSLCYIIPIVFSGKIRIDLPGIELGDYRFGLGEPYVIFYERDNYRGKVHFHILGKNCTNLDESHRAWASSVDVQRRCITVCDEMNCEGHCAKVYPPNPTDRNNKGAAKLRAYGLNDKVKSVKFCYS